MVWRLWRSKALVVFIRRYNNSDLDNLVKVYKSAFAEPPWNEYKKCSSCNAQYSIEEAACLQQGSACNSCNRELTLEDFWSKQDIEKDLEFAKAQDAPIILVADGKNGLAGFTWGYALPLDKFQFLKISVTGKWNYMDEIAVSGNQRGRGVASILGIVYLEEVLRQELAGTILRTDERNNASMGLFKKLGFLPMPDQNKPGKWIYDPEYPNRIYLKRGALQ